MVEENRHATLEIIAPTIEEAIDKGLAELHVSEDDVEIEILDRGNKGLFGLGSRQARIRIVVVGGNHETTAAERPKPKSRTAQGSIGSTQSNGVAEKKTVETPASLPIQPVSDERIARVASETVRDLLERMHIRADVEARFTEADEEGQRPAVWVDITGNDLSILIGRRTQTLQALQYITGLIVGKEIGQSVPIVVDVEGFRSRRADQLKRLAVSMAEQAVKTGRRQTLEPMPANERRIIHIELRKFPDVTTQSVGEEPHRKVTIIPQDQT